MEKIPVEPRTSSWLLEKSQVIERPFVSHKPVLGSFIARFREIWNSVSTKWYVRSLLQQQNEFNRILAEWLYDLDVRLADQDREQTAAIRDAAETVAQIRQMSQMLASIDLRLQRLEAMQASNDPQSRG